MLALAVRPAASARAAMDEEPVLRPDAPWPDAGELVRGVVAGLPDVPVLIRAQLQSKDRRGVIEGVLNAEMKLDWYGRPPSAEYLIRDAFGAEREALRSSWAEPRPPGLPLQPRASPRRRRTCRTCTGRSRARTSAGWI